MSAPGGPAAATEPAARGKGALERAASAGVEPGRPSGRVAWWRSAWAARLAGPGLIVAAVLVVMHGFWLRPKLTNQQVDLLAFWMPRWHFLGTNLAHLRLPTWLPHQFGGVPFASDPQSGWTYLPVMLLFAALSAPRALGLFLVLQPVLAGLGMYLFFRNDGTGRPAATVGGLTLALTMTGSVIALSVPFSGMLAWTAMSLAGASGFLNGRTRRARLWWFALAELSLSQIAAAHLSDGLLIGLVVVGLYVLARSVAQVREGARPWRTAAVRGLALFVAFPALAAAVLLPRLALLPRTPVGQGYQHAAELANRLSGTAAAPPLYERGVGPWWGTSFARGPGGYVGVLAILLIPVALASRRWRWPAAAFALGGFAGWVLNLDRLVASPVVRRIALDLRVGELWLRSPYRFRYLVVVAFAGLAGYGVQAWMDRARPPDQERTAVRIRGAGWRAAVRPGLAWLGPPVAVFALAPLLFGSRPAQYLPFAVGLAAAVPLLLLAARGLRWPAAALAVVAAVELSVAGLVAQGGPVPATAADRLEQVASSGLGRSFPRFHAPFIDPAAYLRPGPIGRALAAGRGSHGRYLAFDPRIARRSVRGFLFHQDRANWPAYENGRSVLFGIDEVQGYSPVQLDRYWRLVRRADRFAPVFYNSSTFQALDPAVLRLFGVRWIVQPASLRPPSPGQAPLAREGRYVLYQVAGAEPRASLVTRWRVVRPGTGLDTVLAPGFDPAREAIVERDPGPAIRAGRPAVGVSGAGTATVYRELSAEHARITVRSPAGGLLVVRNVDDPNWTATVDGRPAAVLPTDYLMQGVAVPPGRHVVDLEYRDTAVGQGLAVSAGAWALLLLVSAALPWWRRHRTPPTKETQP